MATMMVNKVACRVQSSGSDPQGLGQWSWMRLMGKDGLATMVAMAYCLIKSNNAAGCYAQQLQGLTLDGILDCPR